MKTCGKCANMNHGTCRTMVDIPKDRFCFMTTAQAIQAEEDVIEYAMKKLQGSHRSNIRVIAVNVIKKLKQRESL